MRRPHALLCNLSFLEALSWSSREWSKAREVPLSDRIKVRLDWSIVSDLAILR